MDRSHLRPDQRDIVDFIKRKPYCAIWFAMRQGKCAPTLTALQDLYDDIEMSRTLIVSPVKVAINSWPDEFETWEHISLDYQLIRGAPETRIKQLASPAPVHIINREQLPWLVEHICDTVGKENWPYDTVVLDESRSFKNHVPKTPNGRYTRFGAMRLVRPYVERVIELTGTPAPHSYMDLWAQIFLLDGGRRLGKNITQFREEYCLPGREHYMWSINPDKIEEINERIEDIVFSAPGMPIDEPVPNDIIVSMPKKIHSLYNHMFRFGIIQPGGDVEIPALNPGAKVNKLLQISAGSVYDEEGNTHFLHDAKLKCLDELLELIDDNCLLIYSYQFEKQAILDRYPDAVLLDDKSSTVRRWNEGKIPILVMHPASGGHGLTLHRGGSTIIWLTLTTDLELYMQVNKRLSIPGKTKPVEIYRLISDTSVDRARPDILVSRENVQQKLIEHIQRQSTKV